MAKKTMTPVTAASLIDISAIKSAELITGAGRIESFLAERFTKACDELGSAAVKHTRLRESHDGRMLVDKQLPTQARVRESEGAPALASGDDLKAMAEAVGLAWHEDFATRAVPWWASDERVDRHGDIVRQNWDFTDYKNNPVIPFSHQWDLPPIGRAVNWQTVGRAVKGVYEGPALYLLTIFARKDEWDWADTVFRLVKTGFLSTGSVGFYPGTVIDVKDQKEREQLGLGRWGVILDDNQLLEFSPTTIPANPGAYTVLNQAKAAGDIKPCDVQVLREMARVSITRGEGDSDEWAERDSRLTSLWKRLFPTLNIPKRAALDEPVLPLETEEPAASGKAEEDEEEETPQPTMQELMDRLDEVHAIVTSIQETQAGAEETESAEGKDGADEGDAFNRILSLAAAETAATSA